MAGLSAGYNSLLKNSTYGGVTGTPQTGSTTAPTGGVQANTNWYSRTTPAAPAPSPQTEAERAILAMQGPDALKKYQDAQKKAAEEEAFQTDLERQTQATRSLAAATSGLSPTAGTAAAPGEAYGSAGGSAATTSPGGLSLAQIQELMRSFGLGDTTGQSQLPNTTVASPARIEAPAPPSSREAEAAAWARAKDAIGRQTAAAMKDLKGLQAARGFGAESGVYANEEQQVLSEGLRSLGDTARQQAEDALAAEREYQSEVYQGNIAQRGQDIGILGTQASTALTNQNQALQLKLAQLGLLPSFLSLIGQSAY